MLFTAGAGDFKKKNNRGIKQENIDAKERDTRGLEDEGENPPKTVLKNLCVAWFYVLVWSLMGSHRFSIPSQNSEEMRIRFN